MFALNRADIDKLPKNKNIFVLKVCKDGDKILSVSPIEKGTVLLSLFKINFKISQKVKNFLLEKIKKNLDFKFDCVQRNNSFIFEMK